VSGETVGDLSNESPGTMQCMTATSPKPTAAFVPQKAAEKLI